MVLEDRKNKNFLVRYTQGVIRSGFFGVRSGKIGVVPLVKRSAPDGKSERGATPTNSLRIRQLVAVDMLEFFFLKFLSENMDLEMMTLLLLETRALPVPDLKTTCSRI